jgi:hypothetical protein
MNKEEFVSYIFWNKSIQYISTYFILFIIFQHLLCFAIKVSRDECIPDSRT